MTGDSSTKFLILAIGRDKAISDDPKNIYYVVPTYLNE